MSRGSSLFRRYRYIPPYGAPQVAPWRPIGRYVAVPSEQGRPPRPQARPGGMADEGAVSVDEPTETQPQHQTADRPACPCGSRNHKPLKIGEKLSPSGGIIGPVYVCPAQSPAGLSGAL